MLSILECRSSLDITIVSYHQTTRLGWLLVMDEIQNAFLADSSWIVASKLRTTFIERSIPTNSPTTQVVTASPDQSCFSASLFGTNRQCSLASLATTSLHQCVTIKKKQIASLFPLFSLHCTWITCRLIGRWAEHLVTSYSESLSCDSSGTYREMRIRYVPLDRAASRGN